MFDQGQASGKPSVICWDWEPATLHAITDSNGNTPRIGDGDDCVVIRQQLRVEERYVSEIAGLSALAAGQQIPGPLSWRPSLRAAFLGLSPSSPAVPVRSAHFEVGGMTVFRDQGVMLVFDHGPVGFHSTAGHGHADALSLWLHYRGEPIWVDWGTFRYNGASQERDWARSTAAHNTVTLNDQNQSEISGPFNWGRRARCRVLSLDLDGGRISAEHDGYAPITHRRDVHVESDRIVIHDALFGAGAVDVEVRLRLSERCRAESILVAERLFG